MEQGTTEKCECQRYVERFRKAHKNQSGGLGITEKFLRRKNVYFVEEKRGKINKIKNVLLSTKLCNTINVMM